MKIFNIYENEVTKEVIAVKNGFNWLAFFFTWIYALIKKWYVVAGVLFGIGLFISIMSGALMSVRSTGIVIFAKLLLMILNLAFYIILGLKFNQFYEKFLLSQGYKLKQEGVLAKNKKWQNLLICRIIKNRI